MACALTAIGDIQVHMLSLSASGINLTVVVDGAPHGHPRVDVDAYVDGVCAGNRTYLGRAITLAWQKLRWRPEDPGTALPSARHFGIAPRPASAFFDWLCA